MILDTLANCEKYFGAHRGFAKAFGFLREADLAHLEPGKYEIDGGDVFAMVQEPALKPVSAAKLEFHRKYIDIQYIVTGQERMGYSPLCALGHPGEYDASRDLGFASDAPQSMLEVRPGMFAVFFPEDAHAPCLGEGTVRKVVVKVLL